MPRTKRDDLARKFNRRNRVKEGESITLPDPVHHITLRVHQIPEK
jgi:hypothetical protein